MQELLIDSIRTDDGVQSRSAINREYVAELTELLKAGKKLPPVEVFRDGSETWMADGFHRLLAHQDAGARKIRAEVHKGGRKEARWHSIGANLGHGLRRTNEDKRRAVTMALEDRPEASDALIADHCGVHVNTVAAVRRQVPQIVGPVERIGKDGKTYRIPPPPPRNIPPPPSVTPTEPRRIPPPPPSTPPEPAKPTGPVDAVGYPIPDHLQGLFKRGAEVQALLGQISSIKGTLKRAEETGDVLYEDCRMQQAFAALQTAYDTIKATKPYVVCPWCKGVMSDQCRGCGKRGVLGEFRYDTTVPRELKS